MADNEKIVGTSLIDKSDTIGIHIVPNIGVAPDYQYEEDYTHRITAQGVASCYFYTDYDPTKHFIYEIAFNDNNEVDEKQTLENQRVAFAEVIEYHFSFEQVLPKENNFYVKFYRPIYDSSTPEDYDNLASIDYKDVDENKLLEKLIELPTQGEVTGKIREDRQMNETYSKMTVRQLQNLYDRCKNQQPYLDATRWNIHCYNCSLYCRVERPIQVNYYDANPASDITEWRYKIVQATDVNGQPMWQENESGRPDDPNLKHYLDKNGNPITKRGDATKIPIIPYVSAYEFRSQMKLINSVFNTKIPSEDGWYRYNKLTRNWEYLCKINPTLQLAYDFVFTNPNDAPINGGGN